MVGTPLDSLDVRPQYYREKLRAAVEGRPYTPPPPSSAPPRPSSSASARRPARAANDDWDDWGSNPRPRASQSSPNLQAQAGNEYTLGQLEASAKHKEAFFQNKIAVGHDECDHVRKPLARHAQIIIVQAHSLIFFVCAHRKTRRAQRACIPAKGASTLALGPPLHRPPGVLVVLTQ